MQKETMQTEPEMTVEERAELRTKIMANDLNLNEEQREELMDYNTRYYVNYDKMTNRDMDAADRKKMYDRSVKAYDEDMEEMMDEEQFTKYSENKEEYMTDEDIIGERATTPNNRDVDTYQRPR
jgi:hypothetical protein